MRTPQQTLADLGEIRARARAASPGPWRWDTLYQQINDANDELVVETDSEVYRPVPDDRAFIVACRSDVPDLLNLVEHLQERARSAEKERDVARANYKFMVERAADERLDGYRELGARAAAAEERAEVAERRATELQNLLDKARSQHVFSVDRAVKP